MAGRLTLDEFILKSKAVHGNKYDYSNVVYNNCKENVCVTCPIHGAFYVSPDNHYRGRGCPICRYDRPHVVVDGFKKDLDGTLATDKSYALWHSMINRCYSDKAHVKSPSYNGVNICNEWRIFSTFKSWFDKHYVDGWALDKDILVKGNREYAPDKCCFVPQEINSLLCSSSKRRGIYPIGVTLHKQTGKFRADVSTGDKKKYLGLFQSTEEAFAAYKTAKESYIKILAKKWKDKLECHVYEALLNYKVEITD